MFTEVALDKAAESVTKLLSSADYQAMRAAFLELAGFLSGLITIVIGSVRAIDVIRYRNAMRMSPAEYASGTEQRLALYLQLLERERDQLRSTVESQAQTIASLNETIAAEKQRLDERAIIAEIQHDEVLSAAESLSQKDGV